MRNIRHPYAKICIRHEEEFDFREARNKNILLTVYRDGNCVMLKTYSRKAGKREWFFVRYDKLSDWDHSGSGDFYDFECGNILRILPYPEIQELRFNFWWLSEGLNGGLSGVHQEFTVDWEMFEHAIQATEPVRILCKDTTAPTEFIWSDGARANLRWIAEHKHIRRALCKAFAKGCLRWPGETIHMYADSCTNNRDFYFLASSGIDGGLICHAGKTKNGYPKWEYSTHT